jgi:hypothetical protein
MSRINLILTKIIFPEKIFIIWCGVIERAISSAVVGPHNNCCAPVLPQHTIAALALLAVFVSFDPRPFSK